MSEQAGEYVRVHWGHVDSRPTSLHGNGAAALGTVTLDPADVTCVLCIDLMRSTEHLSWIDQQGDVWRYSHDDGLMHTPETRPFRREHVEKKWGPLRLVDTRLLPGQTDPEAATT